VNARGEARRSLCYSPGLPGEGRGRESRGMGESPQRPPKVKGSRERSESLRHRDRGPEGVLESSIGFASGAGIDADGVILSGLGQGG
jgi:hypothetical protein